MEQKEIQSNVQEWIKDQAKFQAQVLKWTDAQGCPSDAKWKIQEVIDKNGSQPVESVVIDLDLTVNLDINVPNVKIDPIILHCTCYTQKNEDSIRSAVENINERLLEKLDEIISNRCKKHL